MPIKQPVKSYSNNTSLRMMVLSMAMVAMSLLMTACSVNRQQNTTPSLPITEPYQTEGTPAPQATVSPEVSVPPSESPLEGGSSEEEAEKLMATLTLEEKIGQMFFITSRRDKKGNLQLNMDDDLKRTIEQFKPGGFIFFTENLESIDQTVTFIEDLQKSSTIPLFMGIDEEGGVVTRLNKAPLLHSTVMPTPFDIGRTNNTRYAYEAAFAISEEIKSLGFNLNFAPVADIFTNPKNTVIGKRAYASEAELAAKMVEWAVKGSRDCGIIPVIKHFPGHGDTSQDSHTGSAVVEKSLDQLKSTEFIPFKAGIEAGAGMVMTAHVLAPLINDNNLPATLSKPILNILREDLGFDGVIITDGLEMNAISAFYPEDEAVVLAVEAGVDILLLPNDLESAYSAVLNAVRNGRLTEQRIDESVRRILTLKYEWLINAPPLGSLNPENTLGSEEHKALADSIRKDSSP